MPIPQPLHHVAQLRMRRPIEAAHTLLLGRIVVQKSAVFLNVGGGGKFGPELQPDAVGAKTCLPAGLDFRHARGLADARHVFVDGAIERQEYFIAFAERNDVQVVEMRNRLPIIQHADYSVHLIVEVDRLADAVDSAEKSVIHVARDDDDGGTAFVIRCRPRSAVLEWHVEHWEEIRVGRSYHHLERLLLLIRGPQEKMSEVQGALAL